MRGIRRPPHRRERAEHRSALHGTGHARWLMRLPSGIPRSWLEASHEYRNTEFTRPVGYLSTDCNRCVSGNVSYNKVELIYNCPPNVAFPACLHSGESSVALHVSIHIQATLDVHLAHTSPAPGTVVRQRLRIPVYMDAFINTNCQTSRSFRPPPQDASSVTTQTPYPFPSTIAFLDSSRRQWGAARHTATMQGHPRRY